MVDPAVVQEIVTLLVELSKLKVGVAAAAVTFTVTVVVAITPSLSLRAFIVKVAVPMSTADTVTVPALSHVAVKTPELLDETDTLL